MDNLMEIRPLTRKPNQLSYPDDVPWVITSQTTEETRIRLGLRSKDEFQSWLNHYQDKSGYVYRVLRHRKSDGKYSVFKATYRCQHNTVPSHHKAKKPSTKHTNCPAKIEVTIKAVHKRSRGLDAYMPTYPAVVRLIANHNHRSNTLEALKHRDVPEPIRNKFIELFKAGHGPAQALKIHKKDVMVEYGDNYSEYLTDRAVCPDSKWVYYVYNRDFKRLYSKCSSGEKAIKELEHEVQSLQSQGIRIAMESTKEQMHYIALCSPLMDRVHHLETSGHVAFLDGSGNVDRYNCHVFLIMVDSCLGGLPVGALVLSTLNEEILSAALKSYCTLMPANAFGGKGEWGPSIFLADDIKLQENAIKECFPNSLVMFCPSTTFQNGWRWFWDAKHCIDPSERRELYLLFTYLFTCSTEDEFQTYYDTMITSDVVQKYPKLVKYLSELRVQSETWLSCCATNSFSLEDCTNNLNETSVRVLKDKILDKTKAYSPLQMLQFLVTGLTKHYKKKILCSVTSSLDTYFYNQYGILKNDLSNFEITKQNDYLYEVRNSDNPDESFQVSMIGGACECPVGRTIVTCCHQQVVAAKEDIAATRALPVDPESKRHLYWLATGQHQYPPDGLVVDEATDDPFTDEEMPACIDDPSQVTLPQLDEERNCQELLQQYPKSEIECIGNEFLQTVLKFYDSNPKALVMAMRDFRTCFLEKCTSDGETLDFLNSLSVNEEISGEEVGNKMVAAEHDYSYQLE